MIITRTPLRISLVGGGTDVPAFYNIHSGAVVSFTIDKYVYVSVNKKFDGKVRMSYSKTELVEKAEDLQHDLARETLSLFNLKAGLEITSVSDIPGSGTGLGSSSAFTVGLIKALGRKTNNATLAERAFTVEAEKCYHPVGKQDMYASAFGGINYFIFQKKCVHSTPLTPPSQFMEQLNSHSLLLWTGVTRDANEVLAVQSRNFSKGGTIELGEKLTELAHNLQIDILDGISMAMLGEYLQKSWILKTKLADSISNHRIDQWYEAAMNNGAYGGKLLGAGGGGFLYFIAPPYLHEKICKKTGLSKIEFNFEPEGSKVIYES